MGELVYDFDDILAAEKRAREDAAQFIERKADTFPDNNVAQMMARIYRDLASEIRCLDEPAKIESDSLE